jgi:selenium metabolism protein YedF
MIEIDARGMACPRPVVETKKALEQPGAADIRVLVDSKESCQNVERFARSRGCAVTVTAEGAVFRLDIKKGTLTEEKGKKSADMVLITSDRFGSGEARLGGILMKAFLNTLWDADTKPGRIIFVTDGVKLTTEGSDVLDALRLLEADGVEIFSCGTCLDYYQLRDKLKVGKVTNMFEIVSSLVSSGKSITI